MDLIGERFTAGLLQATSAVGNLIFTGLLSILASFFLYFFLLILFLEHLQRNLTKRVPLLTPSTSYTHPPFWDLCVANGPGPGLGRALCVPTAWHGESIMESLASEGVLPPGELWAGGAPVNRAGQPWVASGHFCAAGPLSRPALQGSLVSHPPASPPSSR